eukprot:759193-Hanusia_phi.AAC.1
MSFLSPTPIIECRVTSDHSTVMCPGPGQVFPDRGLHLSVSICDLVPSIIKINSLRLPSFPRRIVDCSICSLS